MRSSHIPTSNLILLVSLFIAFFLNIWGVPLFDLDEGAFAEATREMLESGNFAATWLDGQPRYDKPILSYWFQALSVTLFGLNEFAFRLPSAIAASLWVWAIFLFAKEQWNEETARYAALFMAFTLWIGMIGRAAIADAWLNLFISLAIFDVWRYHQQQSRKIILRIYLWLALGLLTKGPVAVAIPLIVSAIFYMRRGLWLEWLKAVFNPNGWGVLMLVVSPWLLMVYDAQGADFFREFLVNHNLKRFQQTREGHGGQLYYYVLAMPFILLPFSGALFRLLVRGKLVLKEPLAEFLLTWFAVVFVLVSVSQTQLPHYVLYGTAGLLLIFARYRADLFKGGWQLAFPVCFFGILAALPFVVDIAAEQSTRLYEKEMLTRGAAQFQWHYLLFAFLSAGVVLAISFYRSIALYQRLIAVGVVQALFVFNVLMEVVSDIQQQPIKQAASFAMQYPNKEVVSYGIKMPSFSVYRQQITLRRPPQRGDLILTKAHRLEKLQNEFGRERLNVVYRQGGILLVELV